MFSFSVIFRHQALSTNKLSVLPSLILLKTGVLHRLSSLYWAIKTHMPYRSKIAHSRFNCNKQNHILTCVQNKFIKKNLLSPHWLHKNIQPSKGEGTKRPNKRTQGQGEGRRWEKLSTSFHTDVARQNDT